MAYSAFLLESGAAWRLALFEHDFGGLDYRRNCVTHLQFHLFRAASGDNAFDEVVAQHG